MGPSTKNFDLFEIMNSEKEGRSVIQDEETLRQTKRQFVDKTVGADTSHQNQKDSLVKKNKLDHRELESSEDYFSDDIDTTYFNNIHSNVKK